MYWLLRPKTAKVELSSGPFVAPTLADTFGSGAETFEIEFVKIGSPGNPPDTTDRPVTDGAVPYRYRIGKYEISEQMIDKANAESAAAGRPLNIAHDGRGADMPATSITWFEAARFVNWLNTSKGYTAAYKFDAGGNFQLWEPGDPGYNSANLYRNRRARYFLPSINEWHKAAYYDPAANTYYDYPTGSDSVPDGIDVVSDPIFDAVFTDGASNPGPNDITDVGVFSRFDTAGQGGNVVEWGETAFDRLNDVADDQRSARGGAWVSGHTVLAAWTSGIGTSPHFESPAVGFRVASDIPEPSTILLFGAGFVGLLGLRIRDRYSWRRHDA
jgi:formylglycine-generating enzyme required for sulfatase activity